MELNSPQYDYDKLASVGEDVFISRNVEIRRPHLVTVGSHVAIDTGFYCTTRTYVGSYCHIAPYVTVVGGEDGLFQMGDFCTVAAGSRIVCVGDEHLGKGLVGPTIPQPYKDKLISAPVIMRPFSSLGTNAVVLPGVTINEGSVVGAMSLVTKDTEPWTIYYGVPAKPVKARRSDLMKEYGRQLRG